MNVVAGGIVSNADGYANNNSYITVDGTGSKWINNGNLYIGYYGNGTLTVQNAGVVSDTDGYLGGTSVNGYGVATVDGSESMWNNTGSLFVGYAGYGGHLTILNGGTVKVGVGGAGTVYIATGAGTSNYYGELDIGNGNQAGILVASEVNVGQAGRLVFENNDTPYSFSEEITGTGEVEQQGTGATVLTGNSSKFAGKVIVEGGSLTIKNTFGVSDSTNDGYVAGGSTLTVDGLTASLALGTLYIGYPQHGSGNLTLVNGGQVNTTDYVQQDGSQGTLNIAIAGTNVGQYGQINAAGMATFGGTLTVQLASDYTPAMGDTIPIIHYSSYTGTFSNITGLCPVEGFCLRAQYTSNALLLMVVPLTITPLRVSALQANVSAADLVNDPIIPKTDTSILAGAHTPLGLGVVADGVTPVLFAVTGTPGTYSLNLTAGDQSSAVNVTYAGGSLANNLYVLDNGSWIQSASITIPSGGTGGSGTNYAYLQGMDWMSFSGVTAPANQVNATLSLANGVQPITSANFGIRPPPIVLVHGIGSSADTWGDGFIEALEQYAPPEFIRTFTYGKGLGLLPSQWWPSCTENFFDLAKEVDGDLHGIEATFQVNWAFTRYDVVGHSQGGILLRMLCQTIRSTKGPYTSDSSPVVSVSNLYRGRFRRVITIGSPQNGSLIAYYINQMRSSISQIELQLFNAIYFSVPAIQKFDPSKIQIQTINSAFPVDPRIGFHCIRTTINGGEYPLANPFDNPISYNILGLHNVLVLGPDAGKTRGEILIPSGSDGLVDFAGASGRAGTKTSYPFSNVSHSSPELLFGVPANYTQTAYASVGAQVTYLLNGPDSNFGPFILPDPISKETFSAYNQIIPTVRTIANAITRTFAPQIPSTNINFALVVPPGLPLEGAVNWQALVYGTNGITTNWVFAQANTNDSTKVTLSLNSNVVGQVVLLAEYMTTNGDLVFVTPVVAASVPTSLGASMTNIGLNPPAISLAVGDSSPTQIVANNSDGTQTYLYTAPGQVAYFSSNPQIASVDTNGTITMNSFGTATILASYAGMTAQTLVSSPPPSIGNLSGAGSPNGAFQLSFTGTLGTTNLIEASTNLINWVPIGTLYNSNGFVQFLDLASTNFSKRFYRVEIPNVAPTTLSSFVQIASFVQVTNGGFQLTLVGTSGVTNIIQTSSNLTTWTPLSVLYNSNGLIQYNDLTATNSRTKFYRVLIP